MLYERIKLLRKKKGLSQEELAAQLHVVRQTISKWERGYSIPDAEMLTRLACALDVSVDELLGTTAESPEEKKGSDHMRDLAERAKDAII